MQIIINNRLQSSEEYAKNEKANPPFQIEDSVY